jgi:hypothetical protein
MVWIWTATLPADHAVMYMCYCFDPKLLSAAETTNDIFNVRLVNLRVRNLTWCSPTLPLQGSAHDRCCVDLDAASGDTNYLSLYFN